MDIYQIVKYFILTICFKVTLLLDIRPVKIILTLKWPLKCTTLVISIFQPIGENPSFILHNLQFSPTIWCVCVIYLYFMSPILILRSTSSKSFVILYNCIMSPRFLFISKLVYPNFFKLSSYSILLSSKTISEA